MSYKQIKFPGKLSIYDSKLKKISIYGNNENIEVEAILQLSYPRNIFLKLLFKNVTYYSFSWSEDFCFYDIESYKLFRTEEGIYCSFDPFDRNLYVSEEDTDIIESKEIEGSYSFDIEFSNSEKIILE